MAVASSAPSGDVRDRLESVKENVQILSKQIRDGGTSTHNVPSTGSDLSEVLARLVQSAKVVSADCTRLAVAFHQAPSPLARECGVVCQKVEQSALQLAAAFYQLHIKHGKCLWKEVQMATVRILEDLKNLVTLIMKEGCSKSPSQLRNTGGVWLSCDAMDTVSKNNKTAAVKLCLAEVHMLRDALSEVETLKSSNGMSEEDDFDMLLNDADSAMAAATLSDQATGGLLQRTGLGEMMENGGASTSDNNGDRGDKDGAAEARREWTAVERKVVEPCIELIKLSETLAKNGSKFLLTHGDPKEERSIKEMDSTVAAIQRLSPLVDDLASDLPAPLDISQTKKQGRELGKGLLLLLDTLSSCHFCTHAKADGTTGGGSSCWDVIAEESKRTITELLETISR